MRYRSRRWSAPWPVVASLGFIGPPRLSCRRRWPGRDSERASGALGDGSNTGSPATPPFPEDLFTSPSRRARLARGRLFAGVFGVRPSHGSTYVAPSWDPVRQLRPDHMRRALGPRGAWDLRTRAGERCSSSARLRERLRARRISPHANLRAPDGARVQRVPHTLPGADSHGAGVQAQRVRLPEERVARGQEPRGRPELALELGRACIPNGADLVHQYEQAAARHAERDGGVPRPVEHLHRG